MSAALATRQTETAATVGQRNVGQYSNRNLSLQIRNSRHSGANKEKQIIILATLFNYLCCHKLYLQMPFLTTEV